MDFESINFNDLTREELLECIQIIKKERAFTYEDKMKLTILDDSPFTIWASDRDCKITLWEGQCEALYGYNRDFVLGKDFVTLFVAPDEQSAARRDQISIIDHAATFHNIANDVAKNRNTLQLLTNCFRIRDPLTGKYWNAEMGLIIDYFDQEKERLNLIIEESRKVKSHISLFIENSYLLKKQFQARKKTIHSEIVKCQIKAATTKRLSSFRDKIVPIISALDKLQRELYDLIDDYFQRIQECGNADSCEAVMLEFNEIYEEKIYSIENIVIDFVGINSEFSQDDTVMQLRDNLLKDNFDKSTCLLSLAHELLRKADDDIIDFKKIGAEPPSYRLHLLTERRDAIQEIRKTIKKIAEKFTQEIIKANDIEQFNKLCLVMEQNYTQNENELFAFKKIMEEVT